MVIVFAHGALDFVVQTSIAFAQAKLSFGQSGPDTRVEEFAPTLDVSSETRVALVGHGKPGQISGVTGESIGGFLAGNLKKKLERLIITSCYAGEQVGGVAGTSVVEVIAEKLRRHGHGGLEIVGYKGPSIKNAQLGSFAAVVDPLKVGQAGKVQSAALASQTVVPPVTLAGMPGTQPQATAQQMSGFYSTFIDQLDKQNMLLKGDDIARVVVVVD